MCRLLFVFDSVQKSFFFFFKLRLLYWNRIYLGWLVTKDKHDDKGTYVCCFSFYSCDANGKDTLEAWAMLSEWYFWNSFLFFSIQLTTLFAWKRAYIQTQERRGKKRPNCFSFDAGKRKEKKCMIFHIMWIIYIHSKIASGPDLQRKTWKTRLSRNEMMWFDCDFESFRSYRTSPPKCFYNFVIFHSSSLSLFPPWIHRFCCTLSFGVFLSLSSSRWAFFSILYVLMANEKYWWNEVTVALLMFY